MYSIKYKEKNILHRAGKHLKLRLWNMTVHYKLKKELLSKETIFAEALQEHLKY